MDDDGYPREMNNRNAEADDGEEPEELFATAVHELRDGDEFRSADCVSALHRRGGIRIFGLAVEHCECADPIERRIGALVLGQLSYTQNKPFAGRSFGVLEKLLADSDEKVIEDALIALGHLGGVESVLKFPDLVEHANDEIRFAVAFALSGSSDPDAIDVLIKLTRDRDDRVRNWSVFGLGTQSDIDTPELRQILLGCLGDSDEIVRGEALVGLAVRGDRRIIPYLIEEMKADEIDDLVLQAATKIAAPELLPALEALRGKGIKDEEVLEIVIQDCSGVIQLHEDR
jgi:HEAT repeat protein